MITIFNRRQLAVTYESEEKIHICRVLAEQNIPYVVREVHRTAPEMVTVYFVYVRKADFAPAVKALQTKTKA